jgi:hypothetical protein
MAEDAGQPLAGVQIMVKGTTSARSPTAAATTASGCPPAPTRSYSFIGYRTVEREITGR